MKVQHLILALALTAFIVTGCNEQEVNPGDNDHNQPSLVVPDPTPDPEGFVVPEGTIGVYDAVAIAKKLKFNEVSDKRYLIKGYVTSFNRGESFKDDFPVYGNDFFYISAVEPSSLQPEHNIYAYRALGRYGAKFPDLDCVKEGDFVVISCYLTNYNGVYESSGTCFMVASNNKHFNEVYPTIKPIEPKEGEISVTEAEAIISKIEQGKTTDESYKVRGYVCSIDYSKVDSTKTPLGPVYFNMTDGNTVATAYKIYYKVADQDFPSIKQLQLWDEVVLDSKLQNYYGTCEPAYGTMIESSNPNF